MASLAPVTQLKELIKMGNVRPNRGVSRDLWHLLRDTPQTQWSVASVAAELGYDYRVVFNAAYYAVEHKDLPVRRFQQNGVWYVAYDNEVPEDLAEAEPEDGMTEHERGYVDVSDGPGEVEVGGGFVVVTEDEETADGHRVRNRRIEDRSQASAPDLGEGLTTKEWAERELKKPDPSKWEFVGYDKHGNAVLQNGDRVYRAYPI